MLEYRKILVVEDDQVMGEMCRKLLQRKGYTALAVSSATEALDEIERDRAYGIVLADLKMPGMDGIELLKRIKESNSEVEVVIMTGYGTIQNAVEAMKIGASDYITKPFEREELLTVIERIVSVHELESEVARLSAELKADYHFDNIVGQSKQMRDVYDKMVSACKSGSNVLICGESGTGKELVARGIHYGSAQADGPFVPVNCAAMPKDLIESELFGHKKGAFTGATADSVGLFRAAERGTIFLDEITEMPQGAQAKLMRALQEKTVRPVGGTEEVPVEVRVIAATNQDVAGALENGSLRDDLYYRLSVITIIIPPLRERKEDILLLVEYFIDKFNRQSNRALQGIEKRAMECLMEYSWPGNVRELQNVIESAFALGKSDVITQEDLPEKICRGSCEAGLSYPFVSEGVPTLKDAERMLIQRALIEAEGNKSKAAEMLGISRKRLYNKIEIYGIDT